MKIFVAGATGVIGRRLVPMLVQAGHRVTAMTRQQERKDRLVAADAEPVVCDVFDATRLRRVVAEAQPDIVIHQLTEIPQAIDPRRYEEQFAGNDRIRIDGTRNLMEAAAAVGAARVVAQSIAFAYAPVGGWVKTEDDPLYADSPEPFRRSVEALRTLESAVTDREGIDGVVLRYGLFYGAASAYAPDGHFAELVRRRRLPIVGRGDAVASFIHIEDAASATVAALEGPPGVYNVVDDEPAPTREWLPAYAEALGASRPRRVPAFLVRMAGGTYVAYLTTQMRGASNARAKRELEWVPKYRTWRLGFREALG
jgi:nucleoside-diphosphate-sugar epimerase